MTALDADVAVIGLGSWGASALWRLAGRGVSVIGFEANRIAHPYGSSHGHTRLFRVACHEHPGLTPVARLARDLWYELGATSGTELLHQTGAISIGPRGGRALGNTATALAESGVDAEWRTIGELRETYPQHAALPDHYEGIWDAESGYVLVEDALVAAVDAALAAGATVYDRTAVTRVEPDGDTVIVGTADRTFRVGQVVLAAGPWMSIMQDLVTLTAYRAPMLWWRPTESPEDFELDRFPAFIRHYDEENTIWGHGSIGDIPVKAGLSNDPRSKIAVHPDHLERSVRPDRDWGGSAAVLDWAVPGLGRAPYEVAPCMITESPDKQFVVGRTPGAERIVLAGGCSGHGYKHATAIGEILARIVTEEERVVETDFMDPLRFA
ncbi:N-methyl-L-tryptophan oxidase [Labedella phragmitis]|uniref:N-methyl-L-tryptophan oxidase n=1 Tax=Labedella phragmitis TaxID=2498849 RepID=A0A3S3ZAT6_9MICO|nr:N-methyl-L-tryptophan oxidase [Labedella phragmitis]RWZ52662.1 N-methyl-L-tryptophan oxidase [Labedella phragmitis]